MPSNCSAGEDTWESLGQQDQTNPKGNKPWIFIGRTDAEAEASLLWPPDAKSQCIGKDRDAGQDWRQEEKGMTEDERVGWHHRLNGQSLSKLWDLVMHREAWRAAIHGVTKSWTWLSYWTELNWTERLTLVTCEKWLHVPEKSLSNLPVFISAKLQ